MGVVREGKKLIISWPLRRQDFEKIYPIHKDIIRREMQELGFPDQHTLSPNQCARFFQYYGLPHTDCEVKIPGVKIEVLPFEW